MTNDEHIADLENRLAVMESRDERRESEHRNLLKSYGELTYSRETADLKAEYLTERLDQLRTRSQGNGDSAELIDDIYELYKGLLGLLKLHNAMSERLCERLDYLEQGRAQDLERLGKLLDAIAGPQAA